MIISSDLEFFQECIAVERKVQIFLGYVKMQFHFHNKQIVLTPYNLLVRQLQEYVVQLWSPVLPKAIELLERLQGKAAELIPSLRHKGCEQ